MCVGTVDRFILVDTDTDADLRALSFGADSYDLDAIGDQLTLRVDYDDSICPIGSVRFGMDGNETIRIEHVPPYALGQHFGFPTDYQPFPPLTDPGIHVITATPFEGKFATGQKGAALTVTLDVLDSGI